MTESDLPSGPFRFWWMDASRGFAVILVIIFHSATVLKRVGIEYPSFFINFNAFFSPFRMPLLMFLSGMLLSGSLEKGLQRYLSGKIRKVAYPYVIWTIIYFVIIGGISYSWYDPRAWLGHTYLWYLLFIFVFYMIAAFTYKIPSIAISIFALLLSLICEDGTKYGERFFFLMGFFFLGNVVFDSKRIFIKILKSRHVWLLVPVAVIFSTASVLYGPFRYEAEFMPLTISCIIVSIFFIMHLEDLWVTNLFCYIGKNSLVFYVVHFPAIFVSGTICVLAGINMPMVVYLIGFVVAMTAGVLLTEGMHKSFAIRLLFEAPNSRILSNTLDAIDRNVIFRQLFLSGFVMAIIIIWFLCLRGM